jgi:hypothetical protein
MRGFSVSTRPDITSPVPPGLSTEGITEATTLAGIDIFFSLNVCYVNDVHAQCISTLERYTDHRVVLKQHIQNPSALVLFLAGYQR